MPRPNARAGCSENPSGSSSQEDLSDPCRCHYGNGELPKRKQILVAGNQRIRLAGEGYAEKNAIVRVSDLGHDGFGWNCDWLAPWQVFPQQIVPFNVR